MKKIEGNIIDLYRKKIFPGEVHILDGRIVEIRENAKSYSTYICPGFVDAHVHIESSMLTPFHFSALTISKGTVAILNDPHEIANVLGLEGINFMLENSKKALNKIFFGIPSCVPATSYDSAGGVISASDVEMLAKTGRFIALSEMMNVPGVLHRDKEVISKLEIAGRYNLKMDGHAPLLSGQDLRDYAQQGISTDHESSTLDEALEKIANGMQILIREGSAARNYDTLKSLIKTHPDSVMFCTDDSHPDDILDLGHIDKIVRKAICDGFDLFDVLRIATFNPVNYYKMDVGLLQMGDKADLVILENLETFRTLSVYIDGIEKYHLGQKTPFFTETTVLNNFNHDPVSIQELIKPVKNKIIAINVTDGELVTKKEEIYFPEESQNLESDLSRDLLKIVYVNRYNNAVPQVAFITGFGLKQGAFASSISHDSHNILAIGTNDKDICRCINTIIAHRGGLVAEDQAGSVLLSLPIGGIISDQDGEKVATAYKGLNHKLREMGCALHAPFMTLSFMSLIVIPSLKLGEKGLFDFNTFCFLDQ